MLFYSKLIKQFLLLLLFSFSAICQKIDLKSLESEILSNNRQSLYEKSQNRLLKILENKEITNQDRAQVNVLLAVTYKFLSDYPSTINYLKAAKSIAETVPSDTTLMVNINAELAFAYFDSNQYPLADSIMRLMAKTNYKNLELGSKIYIYMQEGYLFFLAKKYNDAGKKYDLALSLMTNKSPCNMPVILTKQMQLFAALGNLPKVEKTYKQIISNADSCKIIQYKLYATEELKNIYENNNLAAKALYYVKVLDTLKLQFDRNNKVSKLHLENQKIIESQKAKEERAFLLKTITYSIMILLLLLASIYLFRKSIAHKKEKELAETELERYKKEIEIYSKEQYTNENKLAEIDIEHSEKLTDRQKELIKLIAQGLSNKEIGEKLFISEATVKYHTKNIYELLNLKNRTDFFAKILKK
jgi:DNA-binding CsgD family transcriptional regulator